MLVIQPFIKPHARYYAGVHLMRATASQARASLIIALSSRWLLVHDFHLRPPPPRTGFSYYQAGCDFC